MRRHYLLLVVLMLTMDITLFAKPVDKDKAKSIAESFWQQKSTTRAASQALRLAYTATDDASVTRSGSPTNLFYVFDRGKADGFVVVAGDDRMRPVLGYTSNGSFDINTSNDGLKWWLDAITAKAKAVASGEDKSTYAATRASGSSVEPIVKTQWNQFSPYNDLCPVDNTDGKGERSLTGCVATAMAQLLYTCYAGTTQTLTGTATCRMAAHITTPTTYDMSQFTIDYSKMVTTYAYNGNESYEAKNEVAKLMYACGLSVNMDYCRNGSGSNASPYTFKKHFGIDSGCQIVHRPQYTSDEWDNLIQGELNAGRAVLYSGTSMDNAGHAFICDGYDGDGLYHINWGWGGYNDGYFDFYSLDFEYVNDQRVICGIKPGTSSLSPTDVLSYESISAVDATLPIEDATSLFFRINKMYCMGDDFNGYVGLAICNGDGSIVSTLSISNYEFNKGRFYSFGRTVTFPTDLADGTYELRAVAGTDENNLQVVNSTGGYTYLTMTVSGGKITVSSSQQKAKLSIESYTIGTDGKCYVGEVTPLTLVIKNEGGEFYGTINNIENASLQMSSIKASFKAGETQTLVTNVKPSSAGALTLEITSIDEHEIEAETIGTVNIDVLAKGATPSLAVESIKMASDEIYYGQQATVVATIRNDGEDFSGGVYVSSKFTDMSCELPSDPVSVTLKKGESTNVEIGIDYLGVLVGKEDTEQTVAIKSIHATYHDDVSGNDYDLTLETFEGYNALTFVVKPVPADPKLSLEKAWMESDVIKNGDKATLHLTINNSGGKFANIIALNWIEREQNFTLWSQNTITIDANATKTIDIDVNYQTAFSTLGIEDGFIELSNITYFLDFPPVTYESLDFDYVAFTVGKKSQTITWNQSFSDNYEGDEITLTATASSGLAIEYAITEGADLAEIRGDVLVCNKPGTVTVEARQQGNDTYKPAASVSKTITIQPKTGINAVSADGVRIAVSDGEVTILGAPSGQKVIVYTPGGAIVKEATTTGEATTIGGLQKGLTYIIKVGNRRVKVAI